MTTIAPPPAPLAETIRVALGRVEHRFNEQVASRVPAMRGLCQHVERYRGKMLRPTLAIVSGLSTGHTRVGVPEPLITVAAVLEIIHMATLVHDDVLDEASVRRGGETVNTLHGNEAAVILGDYLIARSFHLCSTLDSQQTALRIGEVTSVVCEGELQQLSSRADFSMDLDLYHEIIGAKTAALIAAACELGALHGGGTAEQARRLWVFGDRIGRAFQIQDDLLDLVGNEDLVGKSLGKDLEKGKPTLPLIHHLSSLAPDERAETVARLKAGADDPATRREVAQALADTGSIRYAREEARRLIDEARAELVTLPETGARGYLDALAGMVVDRAF